jgi:hypothetical protein
MTIVFLTVFALPEVNPRWLPPWPVIFVFIALCDALAFALLLRWSGNGHAWDDRHKLAMVAGFLAFFVTFGALQDIDQGFGGLTLVAIATVWALRRLGHEVRARAQDSDLQRTASMTWK